MRGGRLFAATQASLEHWLGEHQPACARPTSGLDGQDAPGLLIGLFFEHVAGVLDGGSSRLRSFGPG